MLLTNVTGLMDGKGEDTLTGLSTNRVDELIETKRYYGRHVA